MGKTIGIIATIGLAVAVNAFPVVGQAISGAIFGGLGAVTGTVGLAASAAFTFSQVAATAITIGATVAGLQSLGGILGLGPSIPRPDQAETAIKTARPVRVKAYGESRLHGAYVCYETSDEGNAVDVYAVHDGEMSELVQYFLADNKVTVNPSTGAVSPLADGTYGGDVVNVRLFSTTGLATATAIPAVVSEIPTVWTNNHRGDGVVLLAGIFNTVKTGDFLEIYPNGVPVASIAAKWSKCPDPRFADPLNKASWVWTDNPICHLLHYMVEIEGVDYATKISPSLQYWINAANVCDELIPLKAGGTEKRYRSCVAFKYTDSYASVRSALMQTCDGWMAVAPDGSYIVYAGKYYNPTVEIGPDDITSYEWNGVGVDDNEVVNEILCFYNSKDHDYNTVETNAWRDEADIAKRGEIITETFEPQTNSWGTVRRLAKRNMIRKNMLHRGTVTTNASGRAVRGQRFINLRLEEAGAVFFNGPVEIVNVTRNIQTAGVTFSWVEADPNVDAWNPALEEGDPAPMGTNIAPTPVATPIIDDILVEFVGSGDFTQLTVEVSNWSRPDTTWFTHWRIAGTDNWTSAMSDDIDLGAGVSLIIPTVPANATVEVAVSFVTGNGQTSLWSNIETVSTSTASVPSGIVTEVTSLGSAGNAEIAWRNPTTSNYSSTRIYRNTADDLETAIQVGGDFLGSLGQHMVYDDAVSAGTYYYWLRTVSVNNVLSAAVATGSVVVT